MKLLGFASLMIKDLIFKSTADHSQNKHQIDA